MKIVVELWVSLHEIDWINALQNYWINPSVQRDPELERRMANLNSDAIKLFGEQEWYDFLQDEYFPWKFEGNWLPRKLEFLKKYTQTRTGLGYLLSIKKRLFAIDLSNYSGRANALRIAQDINGLGPAGASGLLALLFPRWFGTADKMVVRSLREVLMARQLVVSLAERQKLLAMMRDSKGNETGSLTDDDALLLVDIMRRKAADLNRMFRSDQWTPRKIDMILWDNGTRLCRPRFSTACRDS